MRTIDISQQPIMIPVDVAQCPSCNAQLILVIDEWNECDGTIEVHGDGFHAQCVNEPDFDAGKKRARWDEQHRLEFLQPYIYWLPVDQAIERWLQTVELVNSKIEQNRLERWNAWASQCQMG